MMEDTAGRIMVRAAMKAPYLERDEEHRLALLWKQDNDQNALHSITVAHMRLVIPWPRNSAITACRSAT